MAVRRYMLRLGYCGSRLRGVHKQTPEQEEQCGSVQGLVEKGLHYLKPNTISQLYFSSRTDKGVHALCNTAHVDLLHHTEGQYYEPSTVTNTLNRFYKINNIDIRIHSTTLVPLAFHCRHDAVARRYLYRLAVISDPTECEGFNILKFMPAAEIGKLELVRGPFDPKKLEPVFRLLEGEHNFASFGNASKDKNNQQRETVRRMHSITLTPGRPLLHPSLDPLYSRLQFWDVNIRASSFIYKQVRRTVGVLVAVARGRLTLQDVQHMLDEPSHSNFKPAAKVVSPDGLFLLGVEYPDHVFEERSDGEEVVGEEGGVEEGKESAKEEKKGVEEEKKLVKEEKDIVEEKKESEKEERNIAEGKKEGG